jgi:hypothetical protein
LNRTPASAGNRTTWTLSWWTKRGIVDTGGYGMFSTNSSSTFFDQIAWSGNGLEWIVTNSGGTIVGRLDTTAVYRDPSAWYHIVAVWDSSNATAGNRMRLYVNGAQVTSFTTNTNPAQNTNSNWNNNIASGIGVNNNGSSLSQYFDGYFAEVNFIDGQALTPSSFGTYDTNGVWQPIKYSGSFGTNGFYLNFGNTTSTTTLGYDTSGNSNNWTTNNISLTAGSTYDSMTDSPTVSSASVANYAVFNPLDKGAGITLSNANLTAYSNAQGGYIARSSITVSSGKWYWEATQTAQGSAATNNMVNGICPPSDSTVNILGYTVGSYGYIDTGNKANNSTVTAYGATYGLNDIIGIALDLTAGTLTYYKNGVSQGVAFTGINGTFMAAVSDRGGGVSKEPTWAINFGQRPFTYTPPTGFNALNTYNLPTPTIANGAQYMAATTYTGTGATQTISDGGNNTIGTTFQPDFVWLKSRSASTDHALYDVVRGATLDLASNTVAAETTQATGLTAFGSTGFTIGALAKINTNAATYVGWQWKANGSGVSNTNGSITSTVSANTTAGFSVVTFTGTFAAATVGHGLGVAPSMIIVKTRTQASVDWAVYHTSMGATNGMYLNATNAQFATSTWWNNTSPTSSVFSVAGAAQTNGNAQNMVAYCWAAVAGYSAFGSYTNNGSADGAFIYTGFRPRYVLLKRTDSTGDWIIFDTSRDTYNVVSNELYTDSSSAEITGTGRIDILSNGFKIRITTSEPGYTNGSTMIYAAFAENPFNSSRAR